MSTNRRCLRGQARESEWGPLLPGGRALACGRASVTPAPWSHIQGMPAGSKASAGRHPAPGPKGHQEITRCKTFPSARLHKRLAVIPRQTCLRSSQPCCTTGCCANRLRPRLRSQGLPAAHHRRSSVSSGWKAVASRCLERTATATLARPCASSSLGDSLRVTDQQAWQLLERRG